MAVGVTTKWICFSSVDLYTLQSQIQNKVYDLFLEGSYMERDRIGG